MLWVAEMQNGGVFVADTKQRGLVQMIQHYAENDCSAGQIKSVYYIFKDGRCNEICGDTVGKIQSIIDDRVEEWRRQADQENLGFKEIEQDYWEAAL